MTRRRLAGDLRAPPECAARQVKYAETGAMPVGCSHLPGSNDYAVCDPACGQNRPQQSRELTNLCNNTRKFLPKFPWRSRIFAHHRMTSDRKANANRKNATKSTGPKTVDGKNIVRRNALRHGLAAQVLVTEGEETEDFRAIAGGHLAAFRPRNDVELELVNTFTISAWTRLRCVSTLRGMINCWVSSRSTCSTTPRATWQSSFWPRMRFAR